MINYGVNIKDGRKREIETESSNSIKVDKSGRFIPSIAPPIPGRFTISSLKEMTETEQVPEGDFTNVEDIRLLNDGRVVVSRVFNSYDEAVNNISRNGDMGKTCDFCGSKFHRKGYKLVCPYCYYEKQ